MTDINTVLIAAAVQRELTAMERMFVPGTMLTLLARTPAGESAMFTLDDPEKVMRIALRECKWLPPINVQCEFLEKGIPTVCPLPVTGFRVGTEGEIVVVSSYRPPLPTEVLKEGEVALRLPQTYEDHVALSDVREVNNAFFNFSQDSTQDNAVEAIRAVQAALQIKTHLPT